VKKFLACVTIAFLSVACDNDGGTPTDPSQVNIEYTITDLVVGTGPAAANGSAVTVNYTGWLYNPRGADSKGQMFDTSLAAGRTPLPVTVGTRRVIPGFEQAIVGMSVGGKRRVYIPASLAYGSQGDSTGTIPPNAALVFELELVTVQ
jgi:FKBP-type peptidyl-prolyl cis-trans isomerase FkpA